MIEYPSQNYSGMMYFPGLTISSLKIYKMNVEKKIAKDRNKEHNIVFIWYSYPSIFSIGGRNISENKIFLWEFTGMMGLEAGSEPVQDVRYLERTKETLYSLYISCTFR